MIKILNYKSDLQGMKTYIHEEVLWPVYEYTVAVKGLPSFGSNELETLILRLAEINVRDVNEIAKLSGLEVDLVAFIQERLNHKGFLDEYMQLTENGKAKIDYEAENVNNVQYLKFFRDAVTGDMLSKVILDETEQVLSFFQEAESLEDDGENTKQFVYKDLTSVGEEGIDPKRIAVFDPGKNINLELTTDDIKSVIKKNSMNHANCTFSVCDDAKLAYLTVEVLLEEGNLTDWILTDGFGVPSPFFTGRIDRLSPRNQTYIHNLRKKKYVYDADFKYPKEPDKECKEWIAYPQIGENLERATKLLAEIKSSNPDNSNELEGLVQSKSDCISTIYRLFEWIFFYKCHSRLLEIKGALGNLLKDSERYTKNIIGEEVLELAEKQLKFTPVEEQYKGNFFVPVGRIKHSLKEGEAHDLFSLFAGSVLDAKENDECWIYKIAAAYPDFMNIMSEMKNFRGGAAHANEVKILNEKLEEYFQIAIDFIDMFFAKNRTVEIKKESVQIFDFTEKNNLNGAMSWLEEKLGFAVTRALPSSFLGIAKNMARACMNMNYPEPVANNHIYKLLEQCFFFMNRNGSSVVMQDWYGRARKRAAEAGFTARAEYKSLETASSARIKAAVEGKDVTLQANFIAWLCTENELNLRNLAKDCSFLLQLVNTVSELRGHDDVPSEEDWRRANPGKIIEETIVFIKKLAEFDFFNINL